MIDQYSIAIIAYPYIARALAGPRNSIAGYRAIVTDSISMVTAGYRSYHIGMLKAGMEMEMGSMKPAKRMKYV